MTVKSPDTLVSYGYVSTSDLEMYYQIHGKDSESPILLLHGGLTTIESSFGTLIPSLARERRIIAVEQQGHGRTADINRPMNFRSMASDTAEVLRSLEISSVDVFGYSDGGNVALGLAIAHPELVDRIAIAGTNASIEGLYPEVHSMFATMSAENMPEELRFAYVDIAPRPEDWPTFVKKVMVLGRDYPDWTTDELSSIRQPVLIITGDQDIVRPEHAVELYRTFPTSRLAILPETDHGMNLENPDALLSILGEYFGLALEATAA
jgi:pimeloyl-ACP methyl ester carboxylesterase